MLLKGRPTDGRPALSYIGEPEGSLVGSANRPIGWLIPVGATQGPRGWSAYELAVKGGYAGTEAEWLDSLHGGGVSDSVAWTDITGKPSTFSPSTHSHPVSQVTGLAAVATSGSYTSLSDRPNLATVAITGSYNDLADKPTGGGGSSGPVGWDDVDGKPEFSDVAFSGSYNDLTDKPVGSGSVAWADVTDKPAFGTAAYTSSSAYATATQGVTANAAWNGLLQLQSDAEDMFGSLASVAFSGDYNDLINAPTGGGGTGTGSVAWGDITDKPTFATVAVSGSYNDLLDKPTGGSGAPSWNVVVLDMPSYVAAPGDLLIPNYTDDTTSVIIPDSANAGDTIKLVNCSGEGAVLTFFGLETQDYKEEYTYLGQSLTLVYIDGYDRGSGPNAGWLMVSSTADLSLRP